MNDPAIGYDQVAPRNPDVASAAGHNNPNTQEDIGANSTASFFEAGAANSETNTPPMFRLDEVRETIEPARAESDTTSVETPVPAVTREATSAHQFFGEVASSGTDRAEQNLNRMPQAPLAERLGNSANGLADISDEEIDNVVNSLDRAA